MQKLIFLLCRILAALPLKSLHTMAGFWGGLAFYLLHKEARECSRLEMHPLLRWHSSKVQG